MTDPRVYEYLDVSPSELAELVGQTPSSVERVTGGFTNTLHKATLASGEAFAIKHYAGGRDGFDCEAGALRLLHGIIPVPDLVKAVDGRAIVYRWIEGTTLDECRRSQRAAAVDTLAEPLGRLLAWISRVDAPARWSIDETILQVRAQLGSGRVRERLGGPTADALVAAFVRERDAVAALPPCLTHGDFGARNVLVRPVPVEEVRTPLRVRTGLTAPVPKLADLDLDDLDVVEPRWRIVGVLDWESATADSPLADIGSLFRYNERFSSSFIAAFERGYREADGVLPARWLELARLVDAVQVLDMLDDERELPGVFADCRKIVQKVVAEPRA